MPLPAARAPIPRRAVVAATLGNALEFYDFITFAFFAIQIGQTFFPSKDPFVSLMASLATFGAGFASRPFGALVLGTYADRRGRKPAMLLSMLLMGIGIAILVFTPGYAAIGVAAPVLAVVARLIQGFALGGEVGSATVYLMEAAAGPRRAYVMSWQSASQSIAATVGALVGLMLSLKLSDAQLATIGWRIALAGGLLIVPLALVVRSGLPETIDQPENADEAFSRSGKHWRVMVLGFVIIGTGTIANYIFQYMATFGQNTLHVSAATSMAGEFAGNGIAVVFALWGGALADRHGRRPLMIWPQLAFTVAIVPIFWWLIAERTIVAFVGANLLLQMLIGFQYSAVYAAIGEALPREIRSRAFALVYALPVALLGGTTQLVVTWLLKVTGEPMTIAWYLTGVAGVGLIAMAKMPESAPDRAKQVQ
ncbi:MFS transporter [Sphingomonas sp. ASV193]|uniref:MFS transporter n=1 Tax=Sphingomonas sp. ASV193 TaxID=3144405 RepID=UPI0032E89CA2